MQNLLTLPQNKTMTSVEVVEVINSVRPEDAPVLAHNNFMRRCERVAEELGAISPARGDYLDKQGQSRPCYLLGKEMCLILVASESAKVMQAIIRRWQELEETQKQLLPQTHIEAVRAYLVTLETVEAQQKELGMQQQVITKQDETIEEKKVITDASDIYFSTQRLSSLFYPIKFDGRVLSRKSEEMQIDWQEQHTPFKSQQPIRVYHYAVVEAAYGVDFGY